MPATGDNWEPVRQLGKQWADEHLRVEHVERLRAAVAGDPVNWGQWQHTPLSWGKRLLAVLFELRTGTDLDEAQRRLLEQAGMYQQDLAEERYVRTFVEGVLQSRSA